MMGYRPRRYMVIKVTHTAPNFKPEDITKRYVRAHWGGYAWVEVGKDAKYDIRQGLADPEDVPEPLRVQADERRDVWPPYVEWPW